ncbi:serine/threonine protein kinase [Mesorhizobium sp. CO1-1-7]|nr:serine/threonine protein kinase [Mesorhizobium sp. CO1-1-7]
MGDRYKALSWINAGGMQHVYLAKDSLFGREVALKTPKDDGGNSRFRHSASVSAKINHPNVAKTLDYLEDAAGRAYLIEELVSGADLESVMSNKLRCVPPSTCARVLHQLAKGLVASHHANVVHRDLKPSNIMVVGGFRFAAVKITDFGIAKLAEAEIGLWAESKGSTSSKTVLGAIPYMSPESITEFKVATKPSDVWSIGAIVYEMLSGLPPFGGGLKSILKITEAVPPARPIQISAAQFRSLGSQVYDIILSCLQKDPQKRPTAEFLVQACEELCYSPDEYELGTITRVDPATGFIRADDGPDLMYHRSNFYGTASIKVGKRVWFARHPGTGNDRAFPVVNYGD